MMHNSSRKSLWLKLTFKYLKNTYNTIRMAWLLQTSLPQPAKGEQSRQGVFAYRRKVQNFGLSVQQEGKKTSFCMHEWEKKQVIIRLLLWAVCRHPPRHITPHNFSFLCVEVMSQWGKVWWGRSEEEQVKTTTLRLQTGRMSKAGCEVCQAHKKDHTGMYWTMCPDIFTIKSFSWHMFQSKHNILGWIQR